MSHFIEVLGLPFLSCLAMVAILGYLGIHVLQREIVFIDIALAQIVAVGAVLAQLLFGQHGHDSHCIAPDLLALAFGLVAAAFYAVTRRQKLNIPLEAVIGVSYAIAAAAALFLAGVAPGHVHVGQMLQGSILWVEWPTLRLCALIFLGAGVCFYVLRGPFGKISADYDAALRDGLNVVGWDFIFYTLTAVVITFSVRIGGVVVVFAFLIIPATISILFSSRLSTRLAIAWGSGALGALLGLLFASHLDFSVGSAVALLLGVELVLAALFCRHHPAVSGVVSLLVVGGYVGLLIAFPVSGEAGSHVGTAATSEHDGPHSHSHHETTVPSDDSPPTDTTATHGPENLETLYDKAEAPGTQWEVVLRALAEDASLGASLALRFLEEDPPIFFRQNVVDKLRELVGDSLTYDVTQPFASPANQKAAATIRAKCGGPGQ